MLILMMLSLVIPFGTFDGSHLSRDGQNLMVAESTAPDIVVSGEGESEGPGLLILLGTQVEPQTHFDACLHLPQGLFLFTGSIGSLACRPPPGLDC